MHGIRLAYSSGNVLRNNIVSSDNGCAILLYASVDNRLINNDASNSFQGILMHTSSNNNLVSGNTASDNRKCGIYIRGNNIGSLFSSFSVKLNNHWDGSS